MGRLRQKNFSFGSIICNIKYFTDSNHLFSVEIAFTVELRTDSILRLSKQSCELSLRDSFFSHYAEKFVNIHSFTSCSIFGTTIYYHSQISLSTTFGTFFNYFLILYCFFGTVVLLSTWVIIMKDTKNELKMICNRLRTLIDEKNISYGELSKSTGIPKSALHRYATGETLKIPLDRIESIARVLGVSAAYIMGWDTDNASSFDGVIYRLKTIMKYKNVTMTHLSEKLDISESDLHNFLFETPYNLYDYNDPRFHAIAEQLEISVDAMWGYNNFTSDDFENYISYLFNKIDRNLPMTDRENKIFEDYIKGVFDDENIHNDNIIDNIIPLPKTKMVPLVGTIACGTPILAEENIEDMVPMPEHINADFALRCKGDSMINARILNNDIVYIRKQETVENGEIAAVLIDNEATLKRFYRYGDTVVLRAENPNCKEFEYKKEQLNEIRIIGKAVYFLSAVQ